MITCHCGKQVAAVHPACARRAAPGRVAARGARSAPRVREVVDWRQAELDWGRLTQQQRDAILRRMQRVKE